MPGDQELASSPSKAPLGGLAARLRSLASKPGRMFLSLQKRLRSSSGRPDRASGKDQMATMARKAGKVLLSGGRRIALSLRYHARPKTLNKDYKRFLHLAQEIGYDRPVEKLFFVPTKGYVCLDKLTIDSPNRIFGHDYHPIHRLSFNWAMAQIPDRLSGFTFVDFGAGKGRALLLAAQHPFHRIIGVEFAAELHDDATMNIAQFPRSLMKCRDIDCLLMDAADFPIPESKGVFLFNDSFDQNVLETILARITSSYRANPRRIYLVFVRPLKARVLDHLMERAVIFEPIYHSKSEKLRMQILSPEQVQIFRTLI